MAPAQGWHSRFLGNHTDMGIPPRKIEILLESSPLKSRILVRRLAVPEGLKTESWNFVSAFFRSRSVDIISIHKIVSLRFSNPRTIAYAHFKMPFESRNIPGAGPVFPDWTFENWPQGNSIARSFETDSRVNFHRTKGSRFLDLVFSTVRILATWGGRSFCKLRPFCSLRPASQILLTISRDVPPPKGSGSMRATSTASAQLLINKVLLVVLSIISIIMIIHIARARPFRTQILRLWAQEGDLNGHRPSRKTESMHHHHPEGVEYEATCLNSSTVAVPKVTSGRWWCIKLFFPLSESGCWDDMWYCGIMVSWVVVLWCCGIVVLRRQSGEREMSWYCGIALRRAVSSSA